MTMATSKKPDCLSPRQREIYDAIAHGMSRHGIADMLFKSVKVVDAEIQNIRRVYAIHEPGWRGVLTHALKYHK